MCVVSMVSDYYTGGLGKPWYPGPQLPAAPFPPQPPPVWPSFDDETKRLLREAIERLDKIDKRLGDIECKDELKDSFFRHIGYSGVPDA